MREARPMTNKKYVICPGWIVSQNDGDRHFITAQQLIRLYGVNPKECIVRRERDNVLPWHKELKWLRPKYNGDYQIRRII